MLSIAGTVADTTLTGTLFEPGEEPPSYAGAPDEGAPYVWICDGCFPVAEGGVRQRLGDQTVEIAFEAPLARGFESRTAAVAAAEEHLRTQFARLGAAEADVSVTIDPMTGLS